MEVLGLLRPNHDLKEQEEKIKQFCKDKGLSHYITVFHGTDELTFTEDHKTIVFSSKEVLSQEEREVIMDYASSNDIEVYFTE